MISVCANIKFLIYLFIDLMFEMIKKLNIPYRSFIDNLDEITQLINTQEKNEISFSPWNFEFEGKVLFSTFHNGNTFFIKFFVTEKDVIAKYINPNDPVYKDSCVEFFITFDGDSNYYNFEFNSSGTCLAQYGKSKADRKFLPVKNIQEIKTISAFRNSNLESLIDWELTVAIPAQAFSHHEIKDFSNKKAKINFYKCGDDLPQPHYLCWSPIQSLEPNFHLPEFFGEAIFEN